MRSRRMRPSNERTGRDEDGWQQTLVVEELTLQQQAWRGARCHKEALKREVRLMISDYVFDADDPVDDGIDDLKGTTTNHGRTTKVLSLDSQG